MEVDEPSPEEGEVLVATVAVGVCGTDRDIITGEYRGLGEPRTVLVTGAGPVGLLGAQRGPEVHVADLVDHRA